MNFPRLVVVAQGLAGLSRFHFVGALTHYLRREGHDLRLADAGGPVSPRVAAALTRAPSAEGVVAGAVGDRLLDLIRRARATQVLVVKGSTITPDLVAAMRALPLRPTVACVNTDDPFNLAPGSGNRRIRAAIPAYDRYFVWSRALVEKVNSVGGTGVYLPFASDLDLLERGRTVLHASDVAFVGNADRYRAARLTDLVVAMQKKERSLLVAGKGWRQQPGLAVDETAVEERFIAVLQGAAINLNLLREQNRGATNLRTFEIPATTTFMLHESSAEAEEFFRPGLEAEYFSSPAEAADKVDYYLNHQSARDRIARQARARVDTAGLDYATRFRELATELGLRSQPRRALTKEKTREEMPQISVVIPTYRRDRSLEDLLLALHAQRGITLEIVVVDQNPPGFLATQLGEAALRGVRIIRLEDPNCSTARNQGFVSSSAEHVLFIDDDLVPMPDFCARVVETMQAHPEIGCLVPVVYGLDQDIGAARESYSSVRLGRRRSLDPHIVRIRETMSAVVAFDRETYEASGGFDESLFSFARASEDHELFTRMARRGLSVWLDTSLTILHQDRTPGGAEMRTISRVQNRERCARAWSFKALAHSGGERLSTREAAYLLRYSLFNRRTVGQGPAEAVREIRRLLSAFAAARAFMEPIRDRYRSPLTTSHLSRHQQLTNKDLPAE
jgi:glycosyltransferase involved in cell wall biosynthesis